MAVAGLMCRGGGDVHIEKRVFIMFHYEANGCEMIEGACGDVGGCVDCREGLGVCGQD